MGRIPPVAIGLPVYNGEKYLAESIESVLAQDFGDFDFLISDNCSTDSTWEICNYYAAKDKRIRLNKNEKNFGSILNFNLVVKRTQSQYFMWHAHDDTLLPTFVSTGYEFLERNRDYMSFISDQKIISLYSICHSVKRKDGPQDSNDIVVRVSTHLEMGMPCQSIYGLHRRDLLRMVGPLPILEMGSDTIFVFLMLIVGKIHRHPFPLRTKRECWGEAVSARKNIVNWGPRALLGHQRYVAFFPNIILRRKLFRAIKTHHTLDQTTRLEILNLVEKHLGTWRSFLRDLGYYAFWVSLKFDESFPDWNLFSTCQRCESVLKKLLQIKTK